MEIISFVKSFCDYLITHNIHLYIISFLKIVPGIFLTFFSIYFAYRKIFYKVSIYYSTGFDRISEERIDDIILINEKDRPVIVNEVIVVCKNKWVLSVHNFSTPQILKPLEMINIKTIPVSNYILDRKNTDLSLLDERKNLCFYLCTDKKIIKLRTIGSPNYLTHKRFNNIKKVQKRQNIFAGIIYNDNVKYFLQYSFDGINNKIAYIDNSGLIDGDWDFTYNMLNIKNINDESEILSVVKKNDFEHKLKYIKLVDPRKKTS